MDWNPLPVLLLSLTLPASARQSSAPGTPTEPVITVAGKSFATWGDYLASDEFKTLGLRCQAPERDDSVQSFMPPSDCGANSTSILPQYEPANSPVVTIPVVVHILMSSGGTGNISDALVQSQIDILNEDFGALPGSNGAGGVDTGIRFALATEDPDGNPTTGITRSMNTSWFNDSGAYWNSLAWDTTRYLNIYTNQASGALGYVPCLPQCGGLVGSNSDRVVVLWSSFGRNAPIGPPYNQGRTATHELGHYFGLEHTFSGGCASPGNCYANGDLICDTNPESGPVFGCPGSHSSCGNPDPYDNYMDYSDDLCMERFTAEQANRMRCTLVNWRPDLGMSCSVVASAAVRVGTNPNVYVVDPPVLGSSVQFQVVASGYRVATVLAYGQPGNILLPNGQTVLFDPTSGFIFSLAVPGLPFASLTQTVPANTALCGQTVTTQAVLTGPVGASPPFQLTNAVDLTPGI